MSRNVAALVYRKRVGSMPRKAILAYCAERANDDGSGIWASKSRIAKEVECSKQTVIETMRGLVADGLMREVGQRKTTNGYVVEYAISISRLMHLPDAFESVFALDDREGSKSGPVKEVDLTSQPAGPHQSRRLTPPVKEVDPNRPLTVLEPSLNQEDIGSYEPLGLFKENLPVSASKQTTVDEAVQAFNRVAEKVGWPCVQKMTDARRKTLAARVAEVGGLAGWVEAMERAGRAPHLIGRNDRNWCADFDWLCKQANFIKLMEGKYDARGGQGNDPSLRAIANAASAF